MFVDAPSNFQHSLYYDGVNNFYYSYYRNHRKGKNGSSVIVDTKIQDNDVFIYIPNYGWEIISIGDYNRVKVFLETL